MRRLLGGFALGIVIGAVLAWLYQRYLWPKSETVPTRRGPGAAPPDESETLWAMGAEFGGRAGRAAAPPDDSGALRAMGAELGGRAGRATAPPDDLTVIRGIGADFAGRLLAAGIRTFAELAGLTPEAAAERCGVPASRIRRDDWLGQAAALARQAND